MTDYALEYRITDAQERVFEWMHSYVHHNLESGKEALAPYGADWVDPWVNWWGEGDE